MNLTLINSDKRGQIYTIKGVELDDPEITIFITKAGYARGGCIHKENDEYTCVVSGLVEYGIGNNNIILQKGQSALIPRNTPHYFVANHDSVVLEWGASEQEKLTKHKEYRDIVNKINDN